MVLSRAPSRSTLRRYLTPLLLSAAFASLASAAAAQTQSQTPAPPGNRSTGPSDAMPSPASPARDTATPTQGRPLATADQQFVDKVARSGMAEVTLGRAAKERGLADEVKAFGDAMTKDHGQANDELMRLATSRGVNLPAALNAAHRRDSDRLSRLSGAEFDRAFMTHMVSAHRSSVADFEWASANAQDAELKAFATRTLPVLRSHLQMAQATLERLPRRETSGR